MCLSPVVAQGCWQTPLRLSCLPPRLLAMPMLLQDTFCLTFSVEMDYFGDIRTIALKPGGEDIPVTEENRHEYVELMVDYLLNR